MQECHRLRGILEERYEQDRTAWGRIAGVGLRLLQPTAAELGDESAAIMQLAAPFRPILEGMIGPRPTFTLLPIPFFTTDMENAVDQEAHLDFRMEKLRN
eukprot:scaffold6112_cov226-Pinguiococcus_pyrenoidosus.AAC.1